MTPSFPQIRDLVLIGGGHAHALVLRMWGMEPLPGTRVTVINPDPVAPYTGMLPGLIAGHYRRDELMIDLVRLGRFAGARVILDRATGIDREARLIHLAGRPPLRYDLAAIDIGITSDLPSLPGSMENAVAAKPLGRYAEAWEAFVTQAPSHPAVVILGAGLGGVELALASAHRLGASAKVTLLDRGDAFLPALAGTARKVLERRLKACGIVLRLGIRMEEVCPTSVMLDGGEVIRSDFTLTATGARPHGWLAELGLREKDGFLVTDAFLRTSDPLIFASGDCAGIEGDPRPKAGVFAVRAAKVLHANLRAALSGKPLKAFRPQVDYLKLISLGKKAAVAEKWGVALSGPSFWRLKDRIDQAFMAKFEDYPAMAGQAVPAVATEGLATLLTARPLCGGCGAKLGPEVLSSALGAVHAPVRGDVLSGPGDDAAVLRAAAGVQVLTTDHLRTFSNDSRLMARLVAIHALGDVWAMGASPQAALAQVTLPPLGPELQARMLAEVMEEAGAVFRAAGADVVGGHSTEGAELTIGFTVTGLADRPIGKGGALPGDALVLTKPLGSGTILAAEMALARAPGVMLGEVWAACIAQMSVAQGSAAAILAPASRAMTDVTGFGLAGHLLEILEASGVAAQVQLADVPVMAGAVELASAGIASSLQPANLAAVSWRMQAPQDARVALLTDPQTCGGLLASVPAERAQGLVAALRAAGHEAAVIGKVVAGAPFLTVAQVGV